MPKVSIIIPVYNEQDRIVQTIEQVISADTLEFSKEIIVVDDGSTDETLSKLKTQNSKFKNEGKKVKITIIEQKKNQGKGSALKEGFKKATGDVFLVQDADNEYTVKDYPALLKSFRDKKTSVVYGSRNKKRENYHNRYSYFSFYAGGLVLTWFINLLFGIRLTDQPTGYKLFSKNFKKLLLVPTENRFSYEVAVTSLLAKQKIPFIEVPIHYSPRSLKEGKKINGIDFIKSVLVAVKYKLFNVQ